MGFQLRDLKYVVSFVLPWAAFCGLYFGGIRSFLVPVVAFGLLPFLELILPASKSNFQESAEPARISQRFFDILLYLNVPLQYGILFTYLWMISFGQHDWIWIIGNTWGTGICCGVMGINVGHELGHRTSAFERILAKLLLLTSLYMHFIIEHNRGHHKNVSSPLDPASADYGESLYAFYPRTIIGGMKSAWHLEELRLSRIGKPVFDVDNEMIRFIFIQFFFCVGIGLFFGWIGLCAFLIVAVLGMLLLETVNYIEHYGLRRKEIEPGVYEKVKPTHSWNSDHELGRIFLYELTRHSDHHYKAQRPYQILRHFDESPQLPLGYPGSMILAVIPPLWFAVMNPRVKNIRHTD